EIPLDMIFADSSAVVVGIVANATPYSERPIGPDTPALYVLEVNGGFCARHGVHNGDRMRFVGFETRTGPERTAPGQELGRCGMAARMVNERADHAQDVEYS